MTFELPALCIKRTNNIDDFLGLVNHNRAMEHTIFGLIKKRGEIAGQHKVAVMAVDAIKADLDANTPGLYGTGSHRSVWK